MSVPFAILVLVGGLAMLALATWLSSRNDPDDTVAKLIWSCVQVSAVLVMLFGGYATYWSLTHRPPVEEVVESSGSSSPTPATPPAVTAAANRKARSMAATLTIKVVDTVTGQTVPGAAVKITYKADDLAAVTGTTDASGTLTLWRQPVGVASEMVVTVPGGTGLSSSPGFNPGANAIDVTMSINHPEKTPDPAPPTTG